MSREREKKGKSRATCAGDGGGGEPSVLPMGTATAGAAASREGEDREGRDGSVSFAMWRGDPAATYSTGHASVSRNLEIREQHRIKEVNVELSQSTNFFASNLYVK